MHWLRKRSLSRVEIATIFEKSPNYTSVSILNEELREKEQQTSLPAIPDFTLAAPEIVIPGQFTTTDLEEEIEQASANFWQHVRGLDGVLALGLLLRKTSQPDPENIHLLRLRCHLKHLLAETYVHAGYAKTAICFCEEAIEAELDLYKQTHSREDLKRYAKTLLLLSRAHIMREEWNTAGKVLKIAEQAFEVAHMPVDPELHRQRAAILMNQGKIEEVAELYGKAFKTFPAHRAHLGYGEEDYYHYDVGIRPLAVLHGSIERAERNLEVAEDWLAGDIHRAINLNWAAAAAFRSDSSQAEHSAQEWLKKAREESYGFGHQMTVTRLLELTPRIPSHLRKEWVLFALHYNAYRNK
jgi:tetratricopeptide (TPR) repeat protein